jgi:hypothetical protein
MRAVCGSTQDTRYPDVAIKTHFSRGVPFGSVRLQADLAWPAKAGYYRNNDFTPQ